MVITDAIGHYSKRLVVALFLIIMTVNAFAKSIYEVQNRMRFETISFEELELDGDLIGAVGSIAQDKLGFMWFGGENGLVRYNGRAFTLYQYKENDPTSIAANEINDLIVDKKGVLWVATHKGLSRYNYEEDHFYNYTSRYPQGLTLSDNNVRELKLDAKQRLLMATDNGVTIFSADRTQSKRFFPSVELNNRVQCLETTDDGRILAALLLNGIFELNENSGQFTPIQVSESDQHLLEKNKDRLITDLYRDKKDRIWVSSVSHPLLRIDPTGKIKKFDSADYDIPVKLDNGWRVFEDSLGWIWVFTDNSGLALYDDKLDRFIPIQPDLFNRHSLVGNQVRSVFEDAQGDIWVGTFTSGVSFHDRSKAPFRTYYTKPGLADSLSHNGILSIHQTKNQEIWVGTEKGLNQFHPSSGTFTSYTINNTSPPMPSDTILSITEDPEGTLWLGTTRSGLLSFDRATGKFRSYTKPQSTPNRNSENFVWKVFYHEESIWAGTLFAGMVEYDLNGQKKSQYSTDSPPGKALLSNYASHFIIDHRGHFWVGTLEGLTILDPGRRTTHHLLRNEANSNTGISRRITALLRDHQDNIWVAIHGKGIHIYDKNRQLLKTIDAENGLNSLMINSLIEDSQGHVWAATHNGISRINTTSYAIKNFQKQHGLVANNHNRDASLLDNQGNLIFGSSDGITLFDPSELRESQSNAPLRLTNLVVNGQDVQKSKAPDIIHQSIQTASDIYLNHTHSSLSIEFALLNYRSAKYNRYTYKLEGLNDNWSLPKRSNRVSFTHLPPGIYTLNIRGKDVNNSWSVGEAKIQIHVKSAPWFTWWAYSVYGLILAGILYLIVQQKRKQLELKQERAINAELLNVAKLKNTFLANTSHELRTPLNGIIGVSEYLRDYCIDNKIEGLIQQLQLISNSGKKLLNLINDVLDFAKYESNSLVLKPEPTNITQCVNEALTIALSDHTNQDVKIIKNLHPAAPLVMVDPARIQQVLLNIIGNAIKHTHQGHIIIENDFDDQFMTLFITDTGTGIPEKELPFLFGIFSQQASEYGQEQGGIGLGLAIAKQIIELHKGRISVESKVGLGSKFSFTVPLASADNPVPMVRDSSIETTPTPVSVKKAISNIQPPPNKELKQDALIVDDDTINRMVMSSIVQEHFNIIEAENGLEAVELVKNNDRIRVVLMDIMMPKMNGFDACKEIRKDKTKFELPIIFVTARNVEEDTSVGFQVGGNDFVEKPITKSKLLPRIQYALQQTQTSL